MPWCGTCKNHMLYPDTHKCPPVWQARVESDNNEDWMEFYARDADEAAEKAAENYDLDDYPLLKGNEAIVEVRLKGSDKIERFCARGESLPHYYVNPVP